MKLRLIQTAVALSIILSSCGGDDNGSPITGGDDGEIPITAAYTATITTDFTEENFPIDYPSNASFGTIIAIVHAQDVSVYTIGQVASEGFKAYVDNNDVDALGSFISTELGEENEGKFTIQTEGTMNASATKTFDVSFTPTRTRLTLIANLSPSPDWFLGVSSFDIVDGENLIENETIGLRALDAGINGGTTFNAPDEIENSAVSIINTPPLSSGNLGLALGQLELTRVD